MFRYIQRRLLVAIPTIFLISIIVFLMLYLIPGDPASIYLGENQSSPERLAEIRHIMGLDRPIYVQYADFVWNALQGDLGDSLRTDRPVTTEIRDRLPNTFKLAFAAMIIAAIIGISLGLIAALNHNTWIDSAAMVFALLGVSIPIFWLAILLIMLFAVRLQWLPATSPPGLKGLILPAFSLALLSAGTLARITRSSMLEVLQQEYLVTARAKGLRSRSVVFSHAMKNALIPIITIMGLQFGALLSGTVITETVFARPGLGSLVITSIQTKDIAVVQGTVLVLAIIYIVMNLIVDLSYAIIDPRIRYE